MKTNLILLFTLLFTLGLSAQVSETERIDAALKRWQTLSAAIPKLGDPPATNYLELPVPDPGGLILAHSLFLFANDYADMDLAPRAWLLAARLLRSLGDPTRALDFAKAALEHEKSVETQKIEARELRALLYSEGGGHSFAVAEFESLKIEYPDHRSLPQWTTQQEAESKLADSKGQVAAQLMNDLRSEDPNTRARASQSMRRFLVSNPLASLAPKMLEYLFKQLGEEPPVSDQVPILERIALFAPDSENWSLACSTVVREMARDGEYEIALMHCHRALARASSLPSSIMTGIDPLVKQLEQGLRQIAQRDLDLTPITKRTRLADLRRKARRNYDSELLAEFIQDFLSDYPGASELAELRFLLAQSMEAKDQSRALGLYRQVAGDDRGGNYGYKATERATALIEKLEDPTAAATFLEGHLPAYADDLQRGWPLTLNQVKRLDRLDRWEEARGLLKPWKEQLQGLDLQAWEKLDEDLAKKVGG